MNCCPKCDHARAKNWMEQHGEAVTEINAYYSFILWVQIRNQFRLLKPLLMFKYIRIVGLIPWKGGPRVPKLRKAIFKLLCSETERENQFYAICLEPYPTHALSNYLALKFPQYDWIAIEIAHQIREDAAPSFSFRQLLPWLAFIASVVPFFRSGWSDWWEALSALQLMAAVYAVLFFVVVPLTIARERRKLKRAGFVLKYLTIGMTDSARAQEQAAGEPT